MVPMLYVGVDIAKREHVIGAVDEHGRPVCKPMAFRNSGEGFEKCVCWLEGIAGDAGDVLVAMEATGHYWMALFSHLVAAGYQACVINPVQVRAVRRLRGMDRVKNDRVDSQLIAETLRIGQCEPSALADDRVQSLRVLTRYHQSMKGDIAECKTQLICILDAYFPEYEGLFADPMCAASLALLALAPLPADLARRRESTVSRTLREASRGRLGDERAAEVMAAAKASVGYRVGSEAASLEARSLVRTIEFLQREADRVAARVSELLHEVEPLVLTIPGVGEVTGAQIVAEIGDISRFTSAKALVRYAGVDSSVSQSGEFDSGGGPISKGGDPYLRRAIWLAASRAWQYDPKLGEFYRKKRAEGKPHRVAVTAVARKLCHIVFAVMRDQKEYDPDR